MAWLLIEIASVLLPLVDAPESLITAFVVLLALGFAVAVFISWAFEMTPEGLKRTQDLSPGEVIPYWSRRKFATFIFGMAGTAFCLSAYHLLFPAPARNLSQSEPVSISQSSPSPSEKPSGTQSSSNFFVISMPNGRKLQQQKMSSRQSLTIRMTRSCSLQTRRAQRRRRRFEMSGKRCSPAPASSSLGSRRKCRSASPARWRWVSGTYELTMNDASGKPINDRGKYLEVWEKQTDGNWKLPPTCGIPISQLPRPHLRKIAGCVRQFTGR